MSVQLPDGTKGVIHVFPGSDAHELATAFCAKHKLEDPKLKQVVERHIVENMKNLKQTASKPSSRPPPPPPASDAVERGGPSGHHQEPPHTPPPPQSAPQSGTVASAGGDGTHGDARALPPAKEAVSQPMPESAGRSSTAQSGHAGEGSSSVSLADVQKENEQLRHDVQSMRRAAADELARVVAAMERDKEAAVAAAAEAANESREAEIAELHAANARIATCAAAASSLRALACLDLVLISSLRALACLDLVLISSLRALACLDLVLISSLRAPPSLARPCMPTLSPRPRSPRSPGPPSR